MEKVEKRKKLENFKKKFESEKNGQSKFSSKSSYNFWKNACSYMGGFSNKKRFFLLSWNALEKKLEVWYTGRKLEISSILSGKA